jgi:uncharacterized protein DUF6702
MGGGTPAVVIACLVWCLAHPIHTTLANVTYDRASGQVTAMVRAFATDIDRAVAKRPNTDVAEYVRSAITLLDRTGHPMPLAWCGSRREADVLWLCVRAPAAQGMSGMMLADRMLFEVFDDQVNIVMTDGTSFLFTKGDPPRRLP